MMADVIQFPLNKSAPANRNKSLSEDELETIFERKKIVIDDLVDHYATNLINKLAMHGFDVDSQDFIYDYAFMVEALRSTLYRDVGLKHPVQDVSDNARGAYENDYYYEDDEDDPA